MANICKQIPFCEIYEKDLEYKGGERCICHLCDKAPAYSKKWAEQRVQPPIAILEGKKYDDEKLRFDLIPPELLEAIATILTFGAKKYTPNSWQNLPGFNSRYTAALMRHLNAWRSGEKLDKESGHPHLWHIACNVAFLIWKEYNETDTSIEELMRDAYRL